MKKYGISLALVLLTACSNDSGTSDLEDDDVNQEFAKIYSQFPDLPTTTSENVELTGAITWWFWEGDGGCFGSITDGRTTIELQSEADLCEPIEYDEGQKATIEINFDPNKQYTPGSDLYSITKFID